MVYRHGMGYALSGVVAMSPRSPLVSLVVSLFLLGATSWPAANWTAAPLDKEETKKDKTPRGVEVRFGDGRKQKIVLADEPIELTTPYGKLKIPVAAIHRIVFASRIPKETLKVVDAAIADLAHADFQRREE